MHEQRPGLTVRRMMGTVAVFALLLAPAATQSSFAVAFGVLVFGVVLVTALLLLAESVAATARALFRDLGGPSI